MIDVRVAQGGYPGIGRATTGLVRALLAGESPHTFLLLHRPGADLPPTLRAAIRPPHALLPLCAGLRSPLDQIELPLRLRQTRADLYHATYYAMPLAPGRPYVLNVFDLIPERYPEYWGPAQAAVIRAWLRRAVRGARRIFSPSRATTRDLAAFYGVPAARVVAAPLAADPIPPPAGMDAPSNPYLLCICTNKPHKNLTRLVQAYGIARDQHPGLPDLVIAGGWDPRYPEPRDRARALGLDADRGADGRGMVRFVTAPDDAALGALYGQASGFIFPSEYEGFGLPVLEAMLAGLPVAASSTPAVAEVAGDAALSFDPLDPGSIAAALIRLAEDPGLRQRLGAAGRARAARFSWRETARATLATYDEVLCA